MKRKSNRRRKMKVKVNSRKVTAQYQRIFLANCGQTGSRVKTITMRITATVATLDHIMLPLYIQVK
jgi:hypothetical protein